MLRSLLTISLACVVFVPVPSAAMFAISVVQVASARANDVAVTFTNPWGAGNHIVAAITINSATQTVDLTGISVTETVIGGPFTHTSQGLRNYIFCFASDGSDSSFTATTSGSALAAVVAAEMSGASCVADGTASSNDTFGTSHALTTDITTTQAGSLIIGIIGSDSLSDFTVTGSGNSIPADGTDLGPVALGQYYIAGAAGVYDTTYTSAEIETSLIVAGAVRAAGGGGGASAPPRLLMLGIGGR